MAHLASFQSVSPEPAIHLGLRLDAGGIIDVARQPSHHPRTLADPPLAFALLASMLNFLGGCAIRCARFGATLNSR